MGMLRLEQYSQSAEGITYSYSNAPFSALLIVAGLLLLIVMAIHRTRRGTWSIAEREKIAIEFGVPVVCIAVVVSLSYERQDLVGRYDSPDLIRSDRWVFRLWNPKVSRIAVEDVRAVRIDGVDWRNTRNGSPDGPVRTTYLIRLDVAGERVRLLVGRSRDRKCTEAVAEQLVHFLQSHPDQKLNGDGG